jgi:hypothetical protein
MAITLHTLCGMYGNYGCGHQFLDTVPLNQFFFLLRRLLLPWLGAHILVIAASLALGNA